MLSFWFLLGVVLLSYVDIYISNKLLYSFVSSIITRESVSRGFLCILVNCARETKEKFVERMDY